VSGAAAPEILCVIDARGWVQERRIGQLRREVSDVTLRPVSARGWLRMRRRGDDRPVWFASWRSLRALERQLGRALSSDELGRAMASVTSHYEIGGGLDPRRAVAQGVDPATALPQALTTLRRFDVLTANSRALQQLIAPHRDDVLYVPNGVDVSLFRPDPHEPPHGARREPLRVGCEIRQIRVAKSAWRATLRSPARMARFYRTLDAYVCTSWHEGTPNPALEAAACGVPVVSTAVGNMPELIEQGHNGWLVPPAATAFVEALEKLRSLPPAARDELEHNARARITAAWSWQQRSPAYADAFARLLRESKPASPAITS
jgi:glycosyltransferase involved in cell wall biosynthesis